LLLHLWVINRMWSKLTVVFVKREIKFCKIYKRDKTNSLGFESRKMCTKILKLVSWNGLKLLKSSSSLRIRTGITYVYWVTYKQGLQTLVSNYLFVRIRCALRCSSFSGSLGVGRCAGKASGLGFVTNLKCAIKWMVWNYLKMDSELF
jgi:hypothetical protein